MHKSSLWTQMWSNAGLVNMYIGRLNTKIWMSAFQTHTGWTLIAAFHHLRPDSLLYCRKKIQTGSQEKLSFVSFPYFLSCPTFFLVFTFPFSHHLYLFFFISACVFVVRGAGCFFIVAWPAWLRWLVPLAPPLPLRPLRSVPRPVRCGWGIKPSALCTFARQAGPRCPTPTTLWTTAPPSKTAGPPTPPCLSPHVSAPVWPSLTHTSSQLHTQ